MEDELSIQPAQTIHCAACYTKVNDIDAFCDSCGYPLKGTENEQQDFITHRNVKEIDLNDYTKKIRRAGNTLYWIAGGTVVMGLILYASTKSTTLLLVNFILAVIYALLGVWSQKKPLTAIISGFSLYILIIILNAITNPLSIASGIIIKIIFIGYFINGIKSALEAEKLKKELNIE